jgi:YidC/Oxa1 family membrane protein insertase
MEKRLTIAIVLTIVFLFFYQQFVIKKFEKKAEKKIVQNVAKKKDTKKKNTIKEKTEKKEEKKSNEEKIVKKSIKEPKIEEEDIKNIVYENNLYRAVFSNRGAALLSFKLKKHIGSDNKKLELVSDLSERTGLYPFMVLDKEGESFNKKIYKITKRREGNKTIIEFIFSDGKGDYARKVFTLQEKTYYIKIETNFELNGENKKLYLVWGPGIGRIQQEDLKNISFEFEEKIGYYLNEKVNKIKVMKSEGESTINFQKWIALDIKYFSAILFTKGDIEQAKIKIIKTDGNKKANKFAIVGVKNIKGIYIGPKEFFRLKKLGYSIEDIIEYGFFGVIAKVILYLLLFAYKIFPNYGVAIILVTLFIKLVLLPLTFSSSMSMAKMQEVQPQIKKIQAKYKKFDKKDLEAKKRMNQEIMKLYKEKKVNPAGGCLPLLLQLPILWGFYKLLWVGIETRHQPFVLWITDLSQKDPYYILPILMGLSQIALQKLTPSSGSDKNQKFMGYGMAIFFTLLFLNFQSGLVLYWLTNNLLQVGQQYFVNKALKKKKKEERT